MVSLSLKSRCDNMGNASQVFPYVVPCPLIWQFRHSGGGNTAADLQVEGTLMDRAGNIIETSETTIAYLPPHSTQEGGLFFTENPRQYNLQLRPKGYEVP
jgi:uncharacterized protein (TIGR02588 family)